MIDLYNWNGYVTSENIEQIREALGKRMPTYHVAIGHHELFSKNDLNEGDYLMFLQDKVIVTLIYGQTIKESKAVEIKS